jgi:hypothetical protein
MSLATILVPALALGVALVPVWLLRRRSDARPQDRFVSSQPTRPEVVRNASIAYAARMAAFGPLVAWGASGDLWPALVASVFLGLGILLLHRLRLPLLVFLHGALGRDRSITVHDFIARQHGNDPRVRRLAAGLTLCALLGLAVGEALGLAAFLAPLAPGSAAAVCLLALGALALTVLPAIVAGHSGVMHSAQLQLGMLYFGLFGATAVLLYLHLATRTAMPPHGTVAIAVVAVCCAIMLVYRRSKYVDTDPIGGARALSRFAKILNPCVSVLIVLTIVFALIELYAAGLPAIARDGAAALAAGTRVPGVGLLALCLLPLVYPLVDVASWQNLAAAAKDLGARELDPGRRTAVLRGIFRTCAAESALVWLLLCMLGAIAGAALGAPGDGDPVRGFVARLVAADDEVSALALPLLLVCALAVAVSTMSALFSAGLCTIHYDLLPASGAPMRSMLVAGGGFGLAVAAAFVVAEGLVSFASNAFLAWMFAFACAQLASAPLVLGPIVGRARGGSGTVGPGWALAVLCAGAASGVACATAYLVTGTETWLWAAVPACLGSGGVVFLIGRIASRRTA